MASLLNTTRQKPKHVPLFQYVPNKIFCKLFSLLLCVFHNTWRPLETCFRDILVRDWKNNLWSFGKCWLGNDSGLVMEFCDQRQAFHDVDPPPPPPPPREHMSGAYWFVCLATKSSIYCNNTTCSPNTKLYSDKAKIYRTTGRLYKDYFHEQFYERDILHFTSSCKILKLHINVFVNSLDCPTDIILKYVSFKMSCSRWNIFAYDLFEQDSPKA